MKLILTQEVSGLGAPGDVVEVKDGYGRNFLLPRGLATAWSRGGQKQVDAIQKARETREIHSLEDARQIKATLEARPVTVPARAGASGRLFGAITPAEVADAVKAGGGPSVDKRKIELNTAVKALGRYSAQVRLHADVSAALQLDVVAAQ